jgi:alpha-mannosidase II
LDQYRKKSQLYGGENNHNVVLIPLGDDFRWQDMREANDQYINYEMLINYMNSRKDWNVDIRFGTLSDYFELLKQQSEKKNKRFETLSGDFFTYADRQDHYWSGYFTSRVFYKRLDRLVEYYLRNAEIVFSLSNLAQMDRENKFTVANKLYKQLLVARRNLGLFQHHDGITGTSKTYVVNDYANKYCFLYILTILVYFSLIICL